MKNTLRLLTVAVGVVLMLSAIGCPKKCVKAEEPIAPPPEPVVEEPVLGEHGAMDLNLGTIYFDFDMSDVRAGDAEVLKGNADQLLMAAEKDMMPMVTLEGHCDPLGTAEYNMALGQRRAEAARGRLVKLGVDGNALSAMSYGEEKLATENEDEFGMNRRVEFKVAE